MKPKFILANGASLFLFAASGYSQWAVIDVAHIAQDEVNQTLNYVDYVGTQVNTYEQQLNQVEQLKRLGDPSTLTQMAGLNKLGTSVQTPGAPMLGTPQLTGGTMSLTSGSVLQLNGASSNQIFSSLQGTYQPINSTGYLPAGTRPLPGRRTPTFIMARSPTHRAITPRGWRTLALNKRS